MSAPLADDFAAIAARQREIRAAEKSAQASRDALVVNDGSDALLAIGASLDNWAKYWGVEPRRFGEIDADLRRRIADAMTGLS